MVARDSPPLDMPPSSKVDCQSAFQLVRKAAEKRRATFIRRKKCCSDQTDLYLYVPPDD